MNFCTYAVSNWQLRIACDYRQNILSKHCLALIAGSLNWHITQIHDYGYASVIKHAQRLFWLFVPCWNLVSVAFTACLFACLEIHSQTVTLLMTVLACLLTFLTCFCLRMNFGGCIDFRVTIDKYAVIDMIDTPDRQFTWSKEDESRLNDLNQTCRSLQVRHDWTWGASWWQNAIESSFVIHSLRRLTTYASWLT